MSPCPAAFYIVHYVLHLETQEAGLVPSNQQPWHFSFWTTSTKLLKIRYLFLGRGDFNLFFPVVEDGTFLWLWIEVTLIWVDSEGNGGGKEMVPPKQLIFMSVMALCWPYGTLQTAPEFCIRPQRCKLSLANLVTQFGRTSSDLPLWTETLLVGFGDRTLKWKTEISEPPPHQSPQPAYKLWFVY
jgi:hypothetical protein